MTAQQGERLFYKGEEYIMATEPLEYFLSKINIIRPGDFGMCTSCWRGYIGTWEIDDHKLFLVGLEGCPTKESTDLNYVFPNQEKIFANWFSGCIRIPFGKMLEYIHMGYASTFEKDIILTLENGVVIHEEEIDNRERGGLFSKIINRLSEL
jgi:hypothetical protein